MNYENTREVIESMLKNKVNVISIKTKDDYRILCPINKDTFTSEIFNLYAFRIDGDFESIETSNGFISPCILRLEKGKLNYLSLDSVELVRNVVVCKIGTSDEASRFTMAFEIDRNYIELIDK